MHEVVNVSSVNIANNMHNYCNQNVQNVRLLPMKKEPYKHQCAEKNMCKKREYSSRDKEGDAAVFCIFYCVFLYFLINATRIGILQ
jgi:hypothetical protein